MQNQNKVIPVVVFQHDYRDSMRCGNLLIDAGWTEEDIQLASVPEGIPDSLKGGDAMECLILGSFPRTSPVHAGMLEWVTGLRLQYRNLIIVSYSQMVLPGRFDYICRKIHGAGDGFKELVRKLRMGQIKRVGGTTSIVSPEEETLLAEA